MYSITEKVKEKLYDSLIEKISKEFNIGESELRHYLVVEITEPLLVLHLPNDIIKALLIFRDRYEKKVIKFKKILKIFS